MQEILYRNGVFYINDRDKQSNFTFNNKDINNIYEMKVSYKGFSFYEINWWSSLTFMIIF